MKDFTTTDESCTAVVSGRPTPDPSEEGIDRRGRLSDTMGEGKVFNLLS